MAGTTRFEVIEGDRRRHPRQPVHHPVVLDMLRSGLRIPCQSVDVSVGGIRVRSTDPIPLGACDVVVSVDAEDRLALVGSVVETVEAPDGASTARIMFLPVLSESADAGRSPAVVVSRPVADEPGRGRRTVVLVAGVAAALAVIVGVALATRSDGPADGPTATARPPATSTIPTVVAPRPPATSALPAPPTTAASPPVTTAPVTTTPPATTPVPRIEGADNIVHVTLGTTADDTAVASFVGPTDGVDPVRMQLNVTPEPVGTSLPLEVTIENRGDDVLAFTDGIRATITASREGVAVATATFTDADITDVGPGEVVRVGGLFDFGAVGDYDLAIAVDVTE